MKGRRPTDWELFSGILPSGIQPCWIFENGAIFPNCACYYEEHSLWPRFKKELQDVTAVDMDATQDDKVIITLEFAKPKEVIQ